MGEFSQSFAVTCDDGRKNNWSAEKAKALIREKLGNDADKAIELFKNAYPKRKLQDLLFTDCLLRPGTMRITSSRPIFPGLRNNFRISYAGAGAVSQKAECQTSGYFRMDALYG